MSKIEIKDNNGFVTIKQKREKQISLFVADLGFIEAYNREETTCLSFKANNCTRWFEIPKTKRSLGYMKKIADELIALMLKYRVDNEGVAGEEVEFVPETQPRSLTFGRNSDIRE
jgi:hypothetical protein